MAADGTRGFERHRALHRQGQSDAGQELRPGTARQDQAACAASRTWPSGAAGLAWVVARTHRASELHRFLSCAGRGPHRPDFESEARGATNAVITNPRRATYAMMLDS
jgi:hypothetical protein